MTLLDELANLKPASRELYGNDYESKPNNHCHWSEWHGCWEENDEHFRIRITNELESKK